MWKTSLWGKLKQWSQQESRVLITSAAIAGIVIALRLTGLLQSLEWALLDQLFRLRPASDIDQKILIVGINETDIQKFKKWPISDGAMAELLEKLNALKPRAIGLDIYRDLATPPGHNEFVKAATSIPNLIGIELINDQKSLGVLPSPILSQRQQIGFNNVIVDADGKVRRNLLYWYLENGKAQESFALKLALIYLKSQGITVEPAGDNSDNFRLGKTIFKRFEENDGAYIRADANGYQILANFRRPSSFITVSMSEVLANQVSPELVRNRLVLIGATAASLQDVFYNPYSGGFIDAAQPIYGVELHANFLSQILGAALGERTLINTLSEPVEYIWIWGWSWLGASICWQLRSSRKSVFSILLAGFSLTGFAYIVFLGGWWIPLLPPIICLTGSAITITGYLAHLEQELKRSKEFLQKVINTIADPIFVKDNKHRWIILNQAYCNLVGYTWESLINKSDYDVFPKQEAEVFWKQNELVFQNGEERENEENFTDIRGNTHLISTKRSLHKDAAGNLFLVGVIRDITERKRMEEALKQTAEELRRSNDELKLSENRFRHQANHDLLTGLPNRKQFYDRLSYSMELAHTNNQIVALLFLDLDGFKRVNDNLGHDMGDLLLKIVAQRLTRCLRGSDIVSRLAGDEFTVILPGIPRLEDAAKVAEKILSTLAEAFLLDGNTVFISGSIGISIYPLDTQSMEILIKNADSAMYRAKESGRNRFHFYQE